MPEGPVIECNSAPRLMERFPEKVHRISGIAGDLLTTLEHTNPPFHCSAVKVQRRSRTSKVRLFLLQATAGQG